MRLAGLWVPYRHPVRGFLLRNSSLSMSAITTYFRDALEDLRQVRWPTHQQAVRFSGVVIGFTLICAIAFGMIDFVLSLALKGILSLAS